MPTHDSLREKQERNQAAPKLLTKLTDLLESAINYKSGNKGKLEPLAAAAAAAATRCFQF